MPARPAPVQVALLPVSQGQRASADVIAARLRRAGLRVRVGWRRLASKRIALAHAQARAPFGPSRAREAAAGAVT